MHPSVASVQQQQRAAARFLPALFPQSLLGVVFFSFSRRSRERPALLAVGRAIIQ